MTFALVNASLISNMSDIVSGVLKLTFGFLANKIRKEAVERLKDGDVTDEECRGLIVRELDDIKGKLDGLARQYLLSSLRFLEEGVNRLYESLLQFPSDENTAESTERASLTEASSSRVTGPNPPAPINEAVALINAIASLKIHTSERFKSAVESFKLAREKATEAFCNEALSIEDRIQASQIRMMARILENLEDPEASVSDCLQYLKQLHDVGAIRKIFSVLIDGGIMSRFNQTKRLNNASSVHLMNVILFDFARKLTKCTQGNIFGWPMILLGHKIYNPVFGAEELAENLGKSGMEVLSRYPDFTFAELIDEEYSVVNSKREIVAKVDGENTIKIFKRSGESRTVCKVPMKEHASEWKVAAMDIDAEDNIYVITAYKLFIFDESGNKKLETALSFLQSNWYQSVPIAIHKDGRIAILNESEKILYIGNACVETNSYEVEKSISLNELPGGGIVRGTKLQFFNLNGTKIIVGKWSTVYIYTENGQLQRKIAIPDEHGYVRNVINHVTKCILVKTYRHDGRSSLLSFSESGEIMYSFCLGSSEWLYYAELISHPNGPVALVGDLKAILLQR